MRKQVPLLGAHESTAGGLHLAFDRVAGVGGEALQIFTRNQRQWRAAPLSGEEITAFRDTWARYPGMPVASHGSYLINLGSSSRAQAEKSVQAFAEELRRCEQLSIPWVVLHPGTHGGDGVEKGLASVVRNLDQAICAAGKEAAVRILLETTAGQGTSLGSRFEELARILAGSSYGQRLGVCFDTCHVFAAGYDISSRRGYEETFARFERIIGLDRLRFFHLNDSKKEAGSRVDRHEHIGRGRIGLECFRLLVNDPRFVGHAMTLETPKGKDLAEDRENLRQLHALVPGLTF